MKKWADNRPEKKKGRLMEQPTEETEDSRSCLLINGNTFNRAADGKQVFHPEWEIHSPQDPHNCIPYYQPGWKHNSCHTALTDNYVDIQKSSSEKYELLPSFTIDQLGINLRNEADEETTYDFAQKILDDDLGKTFLKEKSGIFDTFQYEKVVSGSQNAMSSLLQAFKKSENLYSRHDFSSGSTGILLDEALVPSEKCAYEEETAETDGQYVVKEDLFKGSYGLVSRIKDKVTKTVAVRKKILRCFSPSEVATPRDHKNLMKVLGFIIENKQPVLFTEDCGLSMTAFVHNPEKYAMVTETEKWNIMAQGLSGLEYLDYYSCQHLDIKPDNVCLLEESEQLVVKITDFGSARTPLDPLTFQCCTPEYMSVEAAQVFLNRFSEKTGKRYPVNEQDVTGKADVYAWALSMIYLYQKKHIMRALYTNGKDNQINQALQLKMLMELANNPECLENILRVDNCSKDMRCVLKHTLKGNHLERLCAKDAVLLMKRFAKENVHNPVSTILLPKMKEAQVHPFHRFKQANTGIDTIPKGVLNSESHREIRMPIKCTTKIALRRKLQAAPYTKVGNQSQSYAVSPSTPYPDRNRVAYFVEPSTPELPMENSAPFSATGNIPDFSSILN